MQFPLPTSGHVFLEDAEAQAIDFKNMDIYGPVGYFAEVTIGYDTWEAFEKHADFPLIPELCTIEEDDLSELGKKYLREKGPGGLKAALGAKRLIAHGGIRRRVVVHHSELSLALKLGMTLFAVHRVCRFTQEPFLKDYINRIMQNRQDAPTKFLSFFWKWIANTTYGT